MDRETIVNQALGQAGTQSTISSFNEGSPEADVAALYYSTKIDALFRAAPWNSTRMRAPASSCASATGHKFGVGSRSTVCVTA